MTKRIFTILAFTSLLVAQTDASTTFNTSLLGRYNSGYYNPDGGIMEISAFDKTSKRLFSVNGSTGKVEIIDLSTPATPTKLGEIALSAYGIGANSISVKNGVLAVAVEASVKQDNGKVIFFNANDGSFIKEVTVGALPDMLTFTPDGNKVLVANEGEPSDDYSNDPEGSISIIDISTGIANATVTSANFNAFEASKATLIADGVRIYGVNATVSKDMEPEYITISPDSKTAWVTCQENNAIAIVNIDNATVTAIKPLGYKDYNATGNGIDASDRNPSKPSTQINIKNWPVKGMYQPDGIASMVINSNIYLLTANEGDSREYTGLNEEARVSTLTLDATLFPTASTLKKDANIGRLKVTNKLGNTDTDSDFDVLYSFGARSFSIWDANVAQVYDSGDDIEQYIATNFPTRFNVNHNTSNQMSDRSDDKGPEPESVITAVIDNVTYAFVALERQSAIMIYDVTNPLQPQLMQYLSTRNFSETPVSAVGTGVGTGGDLGPEGLLFIPASDSPNKANLIVVSYEISGTVAVYEIATTPINTSLEMLSADNSLEVYPNPVNGSTIQFSKTIVSGSIFNSMGQQLMKIENANQINVANLSKGVFFIHCNNGETVKFIKE